MEVAPGQDRAWRALVAVACLVVIVAGIKAVAPLVNALLLAVILSLTISPLLNWLINRGLPRGLAIAGTILIVIVAGVLLASFLGVSLTRIAGRLPHYEQRLKTMIDAVQSTMVRWHVDPDQVFPTDSVSPQRIIGIVGWLVSGLGNLLGQSLLQLLLVVFILIETPGMHSRLSRGESAENAVLSQFARVAEDLRRYISITGWLGVITAVPSTLVMLALGVDGALLWGVLCFLLSFVPSVGFLLSLLPPTMLSLL
ncbi:MAG: AI-2E family transporter, partial [Tepidisphaeraceae bacterium]